MAADYGLWQGAQQATGTALNTMMTGMALKGQQDYRESQLQLERDKLQMLDQQRKEHAAVYEQQAKHAKLINAQLEKDQELIPADETLQQMGMTRPEQQAQFKARYAPLIEKGPVTGIDMIQRRHAEKVGMDYLKDPQAQLEDSALKVQLAKRELDALDAQLKDPEVMKKMKPDQLAQIQQQRTALVGEVTQGENVAKYLREKLKEPTQNILTKEGWKGVSTRVEGPLGGVPEKVVVAQESNLTKKEIADVRAKVSRLNAEKGKDEAKDEKQALRDDYKDIEKAYTDIIKGESPDPSWTEAEFKLVQAAARRGKSYLPGIRGNRAKLDQAMGWLANPWDTGQTTTGGAKQVDEATAKSFLKQAGGDKNKARELAKKAGYSF